MNRAMWGDFMKYEISFNALNIAGDVVGSATFCITSSAKLDLAKKPLAFQRLCVEYARLIGISCSFAEITDVDERLVGTAHR